MMMMTRTAGGPAAPAWATESRKNRTPAWVWAAAVLSVGAHLGAGAWLMAQRWTAPAVIADPDPDVIDVFTYTPTKPPEPQPVERRQEKPAPTTRFNDTPAPTSPTEDLDVVRGDAADVPSGPIAFEPLPGAAEGGTGTTVVEKPTRLGVVTNPDWVRRPSGDALMRAYPQRALNAGVTGSATLNCVVRVDGTLSGCSVASETPNGQGFGRAALRLSRDFRMSPRTVDGQAVEGARVNVTLRFTLPD
jgi:periplasmic protein TonB